MDSKQQKKQQEAKKIIEKYFHQLTVGCGTIDCKNQYCLSSGLVDRSLTPNQAAVKAIQLYSSEAKLCENIRDDNNVINQKTDTNNKPQQGPSCSSNKKIAISEDDVEMTETDGKKMER